MTLEWSHAISLSARNLAEAPTFLSLASKPGITSFAGGIPDASAFPYDAISAAISAIMDSPSLRAQAFQYAPSMGYEPLRQSLVRNLAKDGVKSDVAGILIANGAQQALDLIGRLLIDPYDAIAITAPTFFAAIDTFSVYRPRMESIAFGENGIDLQQAEAVIAGKPKFLYLIPEFQNPTGLCISLQDRISLLGLCIKHNVMIIEDSAYRDLRFRGEGIPSISRLAQDAGYDGHVLQVSTFSKTISPGLRLGWIAGAPALVSKLAALKLSCDVHTSVFSQCIAAQLIDTDFDKHVVGLKTLYGSKCGAMLAALESCLPEGCSWTRPDGGLFIWLTLPYRIDARHLLEKSLAGSGVAFVPGELFFANRSPKSSCRLSFATVSEPQIASGIQGLGADLTALITRSRGRELVL